LQTEKQNGQQPVTKNRQNPLKNQTGSNLLQKTKTGKPVTKTKTGKPVIKTKRAATR